MKTLNWKHMIEVLISKGIKQTDIAKRCGTQNSTITELKKGVLKNMYWHQGQELLHMYLEACSNE
jgi:DNA-binding NarL/FixJ family response regulator